MLRNSLYSFCYGRYIFNVPDDPIKTSCNENTHFIIINYTGVVQFFIKRQLWSRAQVKIRRFRLKLYQSCGFVTSRESWNIVELVRPWETTKTIKVDIFNPNIIEAVF